MGFGWFWSNIHEISNFGLEKIKFDQIWPSVSSIKIGEKFVESQISRYGYFYSCKGLRIGQEVARMVPCWVLSGLAELEVVFQGDAILVDYWVSTWIMN